MQAYEEGKQESKLIKVEGKMVIDLIQICLRGSALGASMAATWVMVTSNQTTLVFGIEMDAKYSYSSAFKFFAFANVIASVFALLSLSLTVILRRHGFKINHNIFFFMHDLVMTLLLLGGCSAATAIGYVGKYGSSHAGWMPICDHFNSFCHRVTVAVILGYFSLILFLSLTVFSAMSPFVPLQLRNS